MEACPRSSWIARISAPLESRVVAKLCRSVWADTSFIILAFRAYSLILFVIKNRLSRTFVSESCFCIIYFQWIFIEKILSLWKLWRKKRGVNISFSPNKTMRASRDMRILWTEKSVRYTVRIFPHFQRTLNSRVSRLIAEILSAVSSDIRKPVE